MTFEKRDLNSEVKDTKNTTPVNQIQDKVQTKVETDIEYINTNSVPNKGWKKVVDVTVSFVSGAAVATAMSLLLFNTKNHLFAPIAITSSAVFGTVNALRHLLLDKEQRKEDNKIFIKWAAIGGVVGYAVTYGINIYTSAVALTSGTIGVLANYIKRAINNRD
jgi:hypothetical protein